MLCGRVTRLLAASAAAFALPAHAALITFTLDGPVATPSAATSLTLQLAPGGFDSLGTGGTGASVNFTEPCGTVSSVGGGAGVNNCAQGTAWLTNDSTLKEYLRFTFSDTVAFTSVTVQGQSANSDRDVSWLAGGLGGGWTHSDAAGTGNGAVIHPLAGSGTVIRIGARLSDTDDAFKISSITVDYAAASVTPRDVALVPAPATSALLGLGLLVAAGWRSAQRAPSSPRG